MQLVNITSEFPVIQQEELGEGTNREIIILQRILQEFYESIIHYMMMGNLIGSRQEY